MTNTALVLLLLFLLFSSCVEVVAGLRAPFALCPSIIHILMQPGKQMLRNSIPFRLLLRMNAAIMMSAVLATVTERYQEISNCQSVWLLQ